MKIGSVCLLLIFLSNRSLAHVPQEGKIFGTVGPVAHQVYSHQVQDSETSLIGVGIAALAEGDLNDHGGVEIGIIYGSKTYERGYGSNHIAERVNKLSVPIGYRYWFTPSFSVYPAFDASYTMGNPEVVFNNVPGPADTTARAITEYGIDLSVQAEPWSVGRFAVVIDARFFYSITARIGEDANQYSAILGLKYLIQEKSEK